MWLALVLLFCIAKPAATTVKMPAGARCKQGKSDLPLLLCALYDAFFGAFLSQVKHATISCSGTKLPCFGMLCYKAIALVVM